jgi:deoxycytidylate deaminase
MINMKKPASAKQLAVDILERSHCSVKVGAAIEDSTGILAWGWNSVGFDGFGMHAEAHAILRANKRRLAGATIYVATRRARNAKVLTSKPCPECDKLIRRWNLRVVWRDNNGNWIKEG